MQFCLPVKQSLRDSWRAKVPGKYVNSDSDWVRYHAVPQVGQPKENPSNDNSVCYSDCRPNYDQYEITCLPKQLPGVISLEEAEGFFQFFRELGMIPDTIRLGEDKKGVSCYIPRKAGNPHDIYVALTCYRWIDAHPPLVWETLYHMGQPEKRHLFQVLPYVISKYVRNCNHSIINTTHWINTLQNSNNPTLGLAAKIYFDHSDERGKEEYDNPEKYVNETIGKITKKITPMVNKAGSGTWSDNVSIAKYIFEKDEDGLLPELYEMYTIPNITRAQVDEFLAQHFTKEKK